MAEHDTNINPRLSHARQVCEANGERFTPLRAHIYALLLEEDGPVKAYDLLGKLSPQHGSPKPPTVYRALDFFSKLGLIHKVEAINAYVPCGHSHQNDNHGAEFFICETCEQVKESQAHAHINCGPGGFHIRRSVIEHYGQCQNCQREAS